MSSKPNIEIEIAGVREVYEQLIGPFGLPSTEWTVQRRVQKDFKQEGSDLIVLLARNSLTEGQVAEWLGVPRTALRMAMDGCAILRPHTEVVEYLKRKIAELEKAQ